MNRRLVSLADVVQWRLCLGCGACAYICPQGKVSLVNHPEEGIRPVIADGHAAGCDCLRVCPVVASDFECARGAVGRDDFTREWGPVLELWEGHALDFEVRFQGASGGALTAIAAYCLERLKMEGVLHIGQDPEDPLRNRTFLSRTRAELLPRTGSRYAPASVCDRLGWVEQAGAPCVIIGRPVEIAALRNAEKLRPQLKAKVGVALSFFCAESPAAAGTQALLAKLGVPPGEIAELRYRGRGWPGSFAVVRKGENTACRTMSYRESWGFLQAYRPWSARMWPDGTGELADISCGDPWYHKPDGQNPGSSLIVVRTERGREILQGAVAAGYLELKPAERWMLVKSQAGLLSKKGSVWGRRLAMRALGLPVTQFQGLALFHCWWRLAFPEKAKSVLGTLRRIVQRKLYRGLQIATELNGLNGLNALNALNEAKGLKVLGKLKELDGLADIVLMGASLGTGNRGVSALGASFVSLARSHLPGASVGLLLGQRSNAPFRLQCGGQALSVKVLNFRKSPGSRPRENLLLWLALACLYRALPLESIRGLLRRRHPLIRASAQALFIGDIRGGDSFSDIYGARSFLMGSLPILAVLLVRRQIALLPQTYGPFRSTLARRVACFILRRASITLSRDRESIAAVAELIGSTERCRFCPDVAFSLESRVPETLCVEPPLTSVDRQSLIGLNVNGLMFHGGYTRDNMFGLRLDYSQFLVRLTQALLDGSERHLLLVPHTFAPPGRVESDPAACEALLRQLPADTRKRIHLVQREYDQHEIKGVIGLCDFFIGSRMHACIAALSQRIPAVGVAYSKKFKGVFQAVGAEDCVLDGRELNAEQAVQRTLQLYAQRESTRARLKKTVPEAQATIQATFQELFTPPQTPASAAVQAPKLRVAVAGDPR